MSAPDQGHELRLLLCLYPRVCPMLEFLGSLPGTVALRNEDPEPYRTFLSQLLVCVPGGTRSPPQSRQQLSTQRELVARVIQRICEKKRRNVLTVGYGLVYEISKLRVMFALNICSYLPNPTTATIGTSVLWGTLLSRIGDDLMMYLLEHCSLFMLVPPTCCFQICGQPIYDLINGVCIAPAWVRQRHSMHRSNVLVTYIRKKIQHHKRYLVRAKRWKEKRRFQTNTAVILSPSTSKEHDSVFNCQNDETPVVIVHQQPSTSTPHAMVCETKQNETEIDCEINCPVRSTKRPSEAYKAFVPAKRLRSNLTEEDLSVNYPVEENEPNLVTAHDKLCEKFIESSSTTTETHVYSNPEEVASVENDADDLSCKNVIPSTSWASQKSTQVVEEDCGSLRFVSQISSLRPSADVTTKCNTLEEDLGSVQSHIDRPLIRKAMQREAKGISLKNNKPQREKTIKMAKKANPMLPSKINIERRCMLYSSWSLREGFSESFLLNTLKKSTFGGHRLVENIFLHSRIFKQKPDQEPVRSLGKRKRLPKRYWQMRHVFQELIENHKKCPYNVVLRNNCSVRLSKVLSDQNVSVEKDASGMLAQTAADRRKSSNKLAESTDGQQHKVSLAPEDCKVGVTCTAYPSSLMKEADSNDSSVSSMVPDEAMLSHPAKGPKNTSEQSEDSCFLMLLRQHSSQWQVYVFVRECLHRVVPEELWGSNHNKCRFLRNVKTLISLGKFDTFSLRELMWKMRVQDCTWLRLVKGVIEHPQSAGAIHQSLLEMGVLSQPDGDHFVPASEHQFREGVLAKFLYWLMDTYVIQLLRSFFYVTETMFQKNRLFFYRKLIWSKLQKIALGKHFAKVKLRELSNEEVEAFRQQKHKPLIARLRFIPKPNGLRPIVKVDNTLSTKLHCKESDNKHFNTQLKNLFSVLNYERTRRPSLLGATVFGLDEIYKAWKQFIRKVLESNAEKRFYFVKTDVTGAYDTIPLAKLTEVVKKIIDPKVETNYCIRLYAVIWVDSVGHIRRSYKRHVSTMTDLLPDMKLFVSHLQQTTSLQHAILVEQGLSLNESASNLLVFFEQMISSNILKIKDRYHVQCCGIPQGSIVSTLLCSLCYGDMENTLFSTIQQDGLFIRLIDDFLLVTPHLTKAKAFLRTLAEGVPQYGCSIIPQKTVVNFPLDDIPGCSGAKQLPAHCLFPWCGLLFDTQTLEVYCDYSSYACVSIRSSLTFNHSKEAGTNMRRKLMSVLKLKCNSLFVDLMVNSVRTVCINIYKIFLLQAYRFHACVIQLPFNQGVTKNPSFFLSVISDVAPCCYSILKSKNKGVALGARHASGPFPFEAAQWLSYCAFLVKLAHHKAVYKCLLGPLQNCKVRLSRKIPKATMKMLTEVTEPSLHLEFANILN